MAIGAAIFSGVMALKAASDQRSAGKSASAAAEVGAQGIEAETEVNIAQTRLSQAQTLGIAKANIASSGIRFDARKIAEVEFSEEYSSDAAVDGQEQIAGDETGGSIFNYLQQMKKNFAGDIAWQGESGRSRAQVARMGGEVAKAQAYAGATSSYASAAGSFGSAYSGASANVAAGEDWWS